MKKNNQKYTSLAVLLLLIFILGAVYVFTSPKTNVDTGIQKTVSLEENKSVSTIDSENTKSLDGIFFKTYTDGLYKAFSIDYPETWFLKSEEGGNEHVLFAPKEETLLASPDSYANRISITSTSKEAMPGEKFDINELEKLAEEVIGYYENLHQAVLETNNEIEINGSYGRNIELYYDTITGERIFLRQVALLSDKNFELIAAQFSEQDKGEYEPVIDYMIESYRSLL